MPRFYAAVLLVLAGCSESKTPQSTTAKEGSAEPQTAKAEKPNAPQTPKADDALACDKFVGATLLKTHCGIDVDFAPQEPAIPGMCRYTGQSANKNRVNISIERTQPSAWLSTKRRYPAKAAIDTKGIRQLIRTSTYPFRIEIAQIGATKPFECDETQLLALTEAIVKGLPSEPEPETTENSACDALLTAEDLTSTCGSGKGVFPTQMENGKQLYCHRSGPGMIFMVTQHAGAAVARSGEDVAGGYTGSAALAEGNFLIEVKATGSEPPCNDAQLAALAKTAASRLRK